MRSAEFTTRARVRLAQAIPGLQRLRRTLRPRARQATRPAADDFGFSRGLPIDRVYIERFLSRHAADIRGAVLEVGDSAYTSRYGGDNVEQSDVLHPERSRRATVIGDLASGEGIPTDRYDCIIVVQTLNVIYELRPAVKTLHDALRPGGVVLATVPGISQISTLDMESWGDFWRFTTMAAERLFAETFEQVEVVAFGNVASATAFLQGYAAEDLTAEELDEDDPRYQVTIGIRAIRA